MMANVTAVRNTNSSTYAIHDALLGKMIMLKTACFPLVHQGLSFLGGAT